MTPLLSNPLLRVQSDDRLAELAAAGHDRAFEAIVERYRRPLDRYLRRLLSEQLAEDVLQATFVRAWQALGAGTGVRDLRPWLYRIAHNQAVNALRAAGPPGTQLPRGLAARAAAPDVAAAALRREPQRAGRPRGRAPPRLGLERPVARGRRRRLRVGRRGIERPRAERIRIARVGRQRARRPGRAHRR